MYKNVQNTWVNVFRFIPEFRILRLTFHRKSASKYCIVQIIIVSDIIAVKLKTINLLNLKYFYLEGILQVLTF